MHVKNVLLFVFILGKQLQRRSDSSSQFINRMLPNSQEYQEVYQSSGMQNSHLNSNMKLITNVLRFVHQCSALLPSKHGWFPIKLPRKFSLWYLFFPLCLSQLSAIEIFIQSRVNQQIVQPKFHNKCCELLNNIGDIVKLWQGGHCGWKKAQ